MENKDAAPEVAKFDLARLLHLVEQTETEIGLIRAKGADYYALSDEEYQGHLGVLESQLWVARRMLWRWVFGTRFPHISA
jgi:hypothetical protein